MLGILIIAAVFGISFGLGYGVRDALSRRRHRATRGGVPGGQAQLSDALVAGAGPDDAINLKQLLVAANDDLAGRRRAQQPRFRRQVDREVQPDEFDGAVRDLLGELNRRTSGHPLPPRGVRQ